jgi:hypothetical protein
VCRLDTLRHRNRGSWRSAFMCRLDTLRTSGAIGPSFEKTTGSTAPRAFRILPRALLSRSSSMVQGASSEGSSHAPGSPGVTRYFQTQPPSRPLTPIPVDFALFVCRRAPSPKPQRPPPRLNACRFSPQCRRPRKYKTGANEDATAIFHSRKHAPMGRDGC